jgi:hypothetical protein
MLDLEEELLLTQLPKYNLRFYWKSEGRDNRDFEDYSQAYIRKISEHPDLPARPQHLRGGDLRLNAADPRSPSPGVVPTPCASARTAPGTVCGCAPASATAA